MVENRLLPRSRVVTEDQRQLALVAANAAADLTERMRELRERSARLSLERDQLLDQAGRGGISRMELATIIGTQRKVVDDAIKRARKATTRG